MLLEHHQQGFPGQPLPYGCDGRTRNDVQESVHTAFLNRVSYYNISSYDRNTDALARIEVKMQIAMPCRDKEYAAK
jgi:hypothetical protein